MSTVTRSRRCRSPEAAGRGGASGGDAVELFAQRGRGGLARLRRHRRQPGRRRPGCAGGWTASRWPSSWPPCSCARLRSASWPAAWSTASACSPVAAARRCRTSRRCAPPPSGATTSARPPSSCCGRGCRCSPGRSTSRPPRRSAPAAPLAARRSCPPLIGLVDKSVVLRSEEDGTRYRLLDTIREFGAERLADGEAGRGHPGPAHRLLPRPGRRLRRATPRTTTSCPATGGCAASTPISGPPSVRARPAGPGAGSGPAWPPTCGLLGDLRPAARGQALADQDPAPVPRPVARSGPGC